MTKNIIGVCGLACFKCRKFKQDECKGCSPKISADICPLPSCAQEKGVEVCFDCKEFPCENNYKGGPIVAELLDHWKDKWENENKG